MLSCFSRSHFSANEPIVALIATRLLIGAFEAGFYPTAVAYLSTFYTRFDLAVRIGLFYGMYAIAGAFSGSICAPPHSSYHCTSSTDRMIAYGIFQIQHSSIKNWQWLFIIGMFSDVLQIVPELH